MVVDFESRLHQIHGVETSHLAPVFVPASFFAAGNCPGPYTRLRTRDAGLTWAIVPPDRPLCYVDFRTTRHWDSLGIDWRAIALANLAANSGDKPGTHTLRRTTGAVYAVAFMHPDNIGPSRLLLRDQLSSFFPGGYQVALPETGCALAFSTSLQVEEERTVRRLIDGCYRNGPRPLAPGIYSPEDLLPEFSGLSQIR
jgi:hypothetical protein